MRTDANIHWSEPLRVHAARVSLQYKRASPDMTFSRPPSASPIVIPDVHGASALLHAALQHFPERNFVFLGDLIDRGPDSRGVLGATRGLLECGRAQLCWGNHEVLLRDVLTAGDPRARARWLRSGGRRTLVQFPLEADLIHESELLLARAQPWVRLGSLLCVHAARPTLAPGEVNLPPEPLDEHHLWAPPKHNTRPFPAGTLLSVHGHTPVTWPRYIGKDGVRGELYLDLAPHRTGRLAAYDPDARHAVIFSETGPLQTVELRDFSQ